MNYKYYDVTIWRSADNDQGQFVHVNAGISDEDFVRIVKRKKRFIKLVVNDGDIVYVRPANILDMMLLNEF